MISEKYMSCMSTLTSLLWVVIHKTVSDSVLKTEVLDLVTKNGVDLWDD